MATNKRFIAKNGLDNNSQTITNLSDPVNAQDAATKAYVTANSSGGVVYTIKIANYTLVNKDAVAANTTAGVFTLTLPTSPVAGNTVNIIDYAGTFATNNLTIARNGSKIKGLAEDLVCNTTNLLVSLIYVDTTQGWLFSAGSGSTSYQIVQDHNPLNTLTNIPYSVKTAAYNLAVGDSVAANTTAGVFTLTLPATPAVGDLVRICDYAGTFATNNLTIARNGNNINGLAEDLISNVKNVSISLNFIDAVQGWRVV